MVDNNQNLVKYVAAGVGAIALAAGLWYLSRDDEVLDYKRFTKKKLEKLMEEMQLELTCIYARNYNLLLKLKEEKDFDE